MIAFEPSASSYAVLVRNIELNALADRVDAYCVALSDRTKLDHLYSGLPYRRRRTCTLGQTTTVHGELNAIFRHLVPGSTATISSLFGLIALVTSSTSTAFEWQPVLLN